MIKQLAVAVSLGCSLGTVAHGETYAPPYSPPLVRHVLPPMATGANQMSPSLVYEGRSVRIGDIDALYNTSGDKIAYPPSLARP